MRDLKARLDTFVGRVTMYRQMTIVLAALVVVAFVASAVGQLFYTPLELALSLVALLVSTVVTGWLIARIVRTKAHVESSVITALIAFFVFIPVGDVSGMLVLALAGTIASASKYVIAWRERHILNPVAVAAIVIAATALGVAGWWIANPVMLPFVAVGAFLILWRNRRLTVGLTFLVLASVILTVRFGLVGMGVGDSLALAYTSFPMVFLAGFMLSEPLTLPPRRWQQLLVAGIVAVLFSVPYQIGPVYSSPEIALAVGNVVAFAFGQRGALRLALVGSRQLTPTSTEYTFEARRPVRFTAGQYLELALPHRGVDSRGTRRAFSLTSPPSDPRRVSIGVRHAGNGARSSSYKAALASLASGAKLRATWVGGDFVLPSDASTPVVLVAGGIGITPFISHLADRSAGGSAPSDVVLVYAVSSADELAYSDELVAAGVRVLVTGPETPEGLPPSWEHLGAGRVSSERLAAAIPDLASRHGYVSGSPGFVDHVTGELRRAGARRIRTDAFAGY